MNERRGEPQAGRMCCPVVKTPTYPNPPLSKVGIFESPSFSSVKWIREASSKSVKVNG
jgi:hypothetical protein